jgi:hypothetical protein
MITVSSKELLELLGQCAVLRGHGRFDEAIALVEPQIKNMEQAAQEVALIQLIYAASEGGDKTRCLHFARELAKLNPQIPSVKKVLAAYLK